MGVRLSFLAIFILGGIVWWPIFLLAALSAYALVSDLTDGKKSEPDEWFARRWTTTVADPRWRSDFLQFCESPAETAFLNAIIDGYNLEPQKGVLRGGGITLDLQVKIPPYRADFVAQYWLVIEIDGATWHSSAEAVGRDRQRDRFLMQQGYRVLRLPAKSVFDTPLEAVAMVRNAIAAGRPTTVRESPVVSKNPIKGEMANQIASVIAEVNDGVQQMRAVQAAMAGPKAAFAHERQMIESALGSAHRSVEIEDYIRGDPLKQESFDTHTRKIASRLQQVDDSQPVTLANGKPALRLAIPSFTAPAKHPVLDINAAIERTYSTLEKERSDYLNDQRTRLRGKIRLCDFVRANLAAGGRHELWNLITPLPQLRLRPPPP